MHDVKCPECGSGNVTKVDPETAICDDCEYEARSGVFERPLLKGPTVRRPR